MEIILGMVRTDMSIVETIHRVNAVGPHFFLGGNRRGDRRIAGQS